MSLDRVPAGRDVPDDCNVIIEIPMNADPIKYEVDKASGALFVDRFMTTAMHYPCNYGYVPQTLSDDAIQVLADEFDASGQQVGAHGRDVVAPQDLPAMFVADPAWIAPFWPADPGTPARPGAANGQTGNPFRAYAAARR